MSNSRSAVRARRFLGRARRRVGAARRRVGAASATDPQRIARLESRVTDLERELMEARRLNRRLAELTDVVQELLLPAVQRDEQRLTERLDDYASGL